MFDFLVAQRALLLSQADEMMDVVGESARDASNLASDWAFRRHLSAGKQFGGKARGVGEFQRGHLNRAEVIERLVRVTLGAKPIEDVMQSYGAGENETEASVFLAQ